MKISNFIHSTSSGQISGFATRRENFERGFTLIEMIVVFAVVAIISTVAVASFVNYNKAQILQIAISEVVSTLNLAKSRSLSQTKPTECAQQILNGYKVVLSTSQKNYEMYAVCSGTFEYRLGRWNLPKNVEFKPDPTSTSFFFPVIVSGVAGADGTSPPFIISLTAYGVTKTITINSIGGIR